MSKRRTHFILKLDSYDGEDTHLRCGDDAGVQDFLFCVIVTKGDGTAEIVDNGYRSEEELRQAWMEL